MLDERAVAEPDAPDRARGRRRWPWLLGGLIAVVGALGTWWFFAIRTSGASDAAPLFVEEAESAGVEHRYEGGFDYFVGGGVAAFDCNGDARPELYFAGGSAPATLYRNDSDVGGGLTFTPMPSSATDLTDVTGAYPLDLDSDGLVDLMVLRNGSGNELLRGLGNCRFEAANDDFGLAAGDGWTVAFSTTWEGSNALPTLAFGNYLVDGTTDCAPSQFFRPTALSSYDAPVPLATHCTLSVLFSDWNRTGHRDLRVANDRHYYIDGGEQMWRIEPDADPVLYSDDDGWRQLRIWGMGIASQDLTGDGRPEVFLTSQADNKLQTLDDGATEPAYRDIALERGVTAQRPVAGGDVLPSTAWHPQFEDVNNDGFTDLFITKGNVEAQPDYADRDPNDLFIGRADGTFVAATEDAGIVRFERSRGAAVTDLNLDGLLDIVVVNREADVELWRNVGVGDADAPAAMGHWLAIGLEQPEPNVNAVGAWIEVRAEGRTISHEVTIGGGHASGQLGWTHVGLGDATSADVRVQWPDGELGPWMNLDADQYVTLDRVSGSAPLGP